MIHGFAVHMNHI